MLLEKFVLSLHRHTLPRQPDQRCRTRFHRPGCSRREKLDKNPFIGFDTHSRGGLSVMQNLKDEWPHIEPFCEFDPLQPIEELVAEGIGLSLVPQWPGLDHRRWDRKIDLIRDNRYLHRMALIALPNSTRPQLIEALREALLASANPS